jgi:hypothetical protein
MFDLQAWLRSAVAALAFAAATAAHAQVTIGTTLPADFPIVVDASLNKPIVGFGAAGPVTRTPVSLVPAYGAGENDCMLFDPWLLLDA